MLAAQTKLMAALPANLRPNASRMQERFHLDAPGWFGEAEQPKHLRAIAGALLRESLIEIRYQSWRAEKRRRVAPLGLVLKGGSWYLAGHVDGSVRTYRVARVLDCNVLEERFVRPADFDLAPIGKPQPSGSKPRCIRTSPPCGCRRSASNCSTP
jgi:Predicted transcriptional regulator